MRAFLALVVVCIATTHAFKYSFSRAGSLGRLSRLRAEATTDTNILRKIDDWACIKNCGACCKLGPLDSRPDLQEYLSADEYTTYVGMVGADDWCIHFDKQTRLCTNYDNRPGFCTVDPKKFKTMYGVESEDFTDFCRFCCVENITDTFGELSMEMERFEEAMDELQTESDDTLA